MPRVDPAADSGAAAAGEEVLLGLGANLGEPIPQLAAAVEALRQWVVLDRVSSVYRTEPVGHREQPDFYNLVCLGRTTLDPKALLERSMEVERRLGRERSFLNAPRRIDIDLLAYADRVQDDPDLSLPHSRMHQRAFVLAPLAEIAPDWHHPALGLSAADLLASLPLVERVEWWGTL